MPNYLQLELPSTFIILFSKLIQVRAIHETLNGVTTNLSFCQISIIRKNVLGFNALLVIMRQFK